MDLLIGGVSSLHDPLLAAALRGCGFDATALPTPRDEDLEVGRALLPRATPNPGLYLVGAVLRQLGEMARARGVSVAEAASRSALVCVSGRYFHHASQHREAWRAAGIDALPTLDLEFGRVDPIVALSTRLRAPVARVTRALLTAVATGDALLLAGCEARARWMDAPVDEALSHHRDRCVTALESGVAPWSSLAALPTALRGVTSREGPPVRVRVTGDFFASMTDGDGGDGVLRQLGARGARVSPATLSEWVSLWRWRAARGADGDARRRLERVDSVLRTLHRRATTAAGVSAPFADIDDLASLAAAHYPTELLDAPGFVEAGHLLAAARDRSADLVVSLKPFATTPSSAVSDALMHALSQRTDTDFLSIETNGDARAQVASRLDLALDLAAERLRVSGR
ncbi:MAG: hypothetical protein U0326_18310 [Polyangiales bacterium]